MSFEEYGLSPDILSGLADVKIEKPSSLQHEVLSAALQGKHLLVKTEAEEEGAFLIPALQKVAENGEVTGTQVLILTPSIERANKIDEMIWAMGYHAQISSALLSMKGNKNEQEQAVLDGAPVIVANPGRLADILEKNKFQLHNLNLIVIDEAHNMENFNLVSRVKDILRFVEGEPQALILSNLENKATKQLAEMTLKNPERIGFEESNSEEVSQEKIEVTTDEVVIDPVVAEEKLKKASIKVVLKKDIEEAEPIADTPEVVSSEEDSSQTEVEAEEEVSDQKATEGEVIQAEEKLKKSSIKVVLKKDVETTDSTETEVEVEKKASIPVEVGFEQGFINVPPRMKISILMSHLESDSINKVVVFASSKRTTDRLFRIIRKKNWGVASVSDNLDEETFKERYARFTSGEMRILLVGGIPASKLELDDVEQIINYDVPSEIEEYRVRAELVGAGKVSRIISLVSGMDKEDLERITQEVGYAPVELPIPTEVVERKQKKTKEPAKPKVEAKKVPTQKKPKPTAKKPAPKKRPNKAAPKARGKAPARPKKVANKPTSTNQSGLPRPNYDGLSGGREGNTNSGVFGWVKKLFD